MLLGPITLKVAVPVALVSLGGTSFLPESLASKCLDWVEAPVPVPPPAVWPAVLLPEFALPWFVVLLQAAPLRIPEAHYAEVAALFDWAKPWFAVFWPPWANTSEIG